MSIPTIYKGDDTDFRDVDGFKIRLSLAEGLDISGCTVEVLFHGVSRKFPAVPGNETECPVRFTAAETSRFPLGVSFAKVRVWDTEDRVRTIMDTVRIKVTDSVAEAYGSGSVQELVIDIGGDSLPDIPEELSATDDDNVWTLKDKFNSVLSLLRKTAPSCIAALLTLPLFATTPRYSSINRLPGPAEVIMTNTAEYVESEVRKGMDEVSEGMSHFAFFDGTQNDMRVSPIGGIGGFRFVDKTSDGDEFGMSYHAWGDSAWGFALWDKTQFPYSSRAQPYFAVGPFGFTIPTGSSESWSGTINWNKVWNGLSVSDQIFDSSNTNSLRSISSRALNSYMADKLPKMIGCSMETGNVFSATALMKEADGVATYENIIEDAAYLAATSKVVKSITYTDWTSDMTIEKDGTILNHMEFKDDKWHVYVDDNGSLKNYMLFTVEGAEDATVLSYTDEYGTVNFTRTKTIVAENRFGLATLDDIANVRGGITNDVCAIVTNETTVGWRWELHPDFVSATDPVFEAWYLPDGSFGGASWSAVFTMRDGYQMPGNMSAGESDGGRDVVPFYQGTAYRIKGNALGLAMAKDVPTHETVTNIVRKVVNTAGRYVWDKDLEVCYRLNAAGGFLDLVAVTNVDVTLPENWAALEAIENEWRAK